MCIRDRFPWTRSTDVLGKFVNVERAKGIVDGAAPAYRTELMGRQRNEDQKLIPPSCAGLSVVEAHGDLFLLKLKATWHYYSGNLGPRTAWRETASHGLDRLHAGLSRGLTELTRQFSDAWGLAPYDDALPEYHFIGYSLPPGFHVLEPPAGRPCRYVYTPSSDAVEPQEIALTFVRPPSREVQEQIRQTLNDLLSRCQ